MKINKTFEIEEKLFNDFLQFCSINKIENPDDEFLKMFITGFNIAKYGATPFKIVKNENQVKDNEPSLLETTTKTEENEKPSEKKQTKKVKIIKK